MGSDLYSTGFVFPWRMMNEYPKKMKRAVYFSFLSLAVLTACSKDSLKEVDDVCTRMDDSTFAAYCRSNFDTDKDGKVSMQEASVVESIDLKEKGVSSLRGLEYFFNLKFLDCSQNNLSTLDISGNTSLISLDCSLNHLASLDLSKNTKLQRLLSADNEIASLDVSHNTNLTYLQCRSNRISTLDISTLYWLEWLGVGMEYQFGFQKVGTITITDRKDRWATLPQDMEEEGIRWNWI